MPQTKEGALKSVAKYYGFSVGEYLQKINNNFNWCRVCKTWQHCSNFGIDKSRATGLAKVCNICRYKKENPDVPTIRERKAKKNLGLSWCRHHKKWFPKSVVRQGLCRECQNAAYREMYKGDAGFNIRQRAYARKRKIAVLPIEAKKSLFDLYGDLCVYCQSNKTNTYDHLVPVKLGGDTVPGNIIPVCLSCNSSKNATFLEDWILKKNLLVSDMLITAIEIYMLNGGQIQCLEKQV